jgi:hypothetical protein
MVALPTDWRAERAARRVPGSFRAMVSVLGRLLDRGGTGALAPIDRRAGIGGMVVARTLVDRHTPMSCTMSV